MIGVVGAALQFAALIFGYQRAELWTILALAAGSGIGLAFHEPARLNGGAGKPWLGVWTLMGASLFATAVLYGIGRLIRVAVG